MSITWRAAIGVLAWLLRRLFRAAAGAGIERCGGSPGHSARDARHDAVRRDRSRRGWHRDASVQCACCPRPALPAGLCGRSRNPAVARVDHDRTVSGRPRRPPERALSLFRSSGDCRDAAQGTELLHGGVRVVIRARAALRPGARLRCLQRRFPSGSSERTASETTDAAIAEIKAGQSAGRSFSGSITTIRIIPTRLRSRFAPATRRRRISARSRIVDEQLGRLVQAFEERAKRLDVPSAIVVVGDHGEGLGEHGEAQHGNLLYQSTMHVPLVIVGPGVHAGRERHAGEHAPNLRHDARLGRRVVEHSLREANPRIRSRARRGDAAVPRLRMAAAGDDASPTGKKAILAGDDSKPTISRPIRARSKPRDRRPIFRRPRARRSRLSAPSLEAREGAGPRSTRKRSRRLASLGYVSATLRAGRPARARRGPRTWRRCSTSSISASGLFVPEQYAKAIPLLERDPRRGSLQPRRRAAARGRALGARARPQALDMFERARRSRPPPDVRMTWRSTTPAGASGRARRRSSSTSSPDAGSAAGARGPRVVRERQDRLGEAIALRQRIYRVRQPTPPSS